MKKVFFRSYFGKSIIIAIIVLLLVISIFIVYDRNFQSAPLFARRIDSRCEYYKDFLGRVYRREDGSSLFIVFGEFNIWRKVKEIDNKIFFIHSVDTKTNECVGHDKKSVIYRGMVFKGADLDTFESITYEFFKDKYRVYYFSYPLSPDTSNFHPFEVDAMCRGAQTPYSKDTNNVYYGRNIVVGADPNSFEVFCEEEGYKTVMKGKDKKAIYYGGEIENVNQ